MPDDTLFAAIQDRYGFALPPEYRALHARGFFTLDRPATAYDFTAPGGYLWLNDMEWYKLEEIATFEFLSYEAPHLPHLVPFAFTGGGHEWCWQTDHTTDQGARVLLCPHDDMLATIYAPGFAAALYRQALEFACLTGMPDENESRSRAFLRRWAVDLAGVFPPDWCHTLHALGEKPLVHRSEHGIPASGFITPEESSEIVHRDLDFPELDAEIPWSRLKS